MKEYGNQFNEHLEEEIDEKVYTKYLEQQFNPLKLIQDKDWEKGMNLEKFMKLSFTKKLIKNKKHSET